MSFTEGSRRIVSQNENVEFARPNVVAVDPRNVVQFLDQPILKRYEAVEIFDRVCCKLQNGGSMFTFKTGLSKDRTPDITTKTVADGVFIITPNQDLPPGEYLLTFGALGTTGYDFGIK